MGGLIMLALLCPAPVPAQGAELRDNRHGSQP